MLQLENERRGMRIGRCPREQRGLGLSKMWKGRPRRDTQEELRDENRGSRRDTPGRLQDSTDAEAPTTRNQDDAS